MATTKPIRQVTKTITPAGSNLILLDDGISMGKATLSDGVSAVAGDLIDTAIDDLNLGTAAQSDATDFATAAQGATADTAVQPGNLSAVATTGAYSDLSGAPTLGTGAALDAPSNPDLSVDTGKLALRGDVKTYVDTGTVYKVADRTALKALDTGAHKAVYLLESGREGQFVWSSADLSTLVTADTEEGVYIAPTSDDTGASGAWVRIHDGELRPEMFGAAGDGATDDSAAFQAMLDVAITAHRPARLSVAKYIINTALSATLASTDDLVVRGCGVEASQIQCAANSFINATVAGTGDPRGDKAYLEFSGFSCETTSSGAAKAITVVNSDASGLVVNSTFLRACDLNFTGTASNYWSAGISTIDVANYDFSRIYGQGYDNLGRLIELLGYSAPVDDRLHSIRVKNMETAIYAEGNFESLTVDALTAVSVKYGIYAISRSAADTPDRHPQVTVINTHINVTVADGSCVLIDGMSVPYIGAGCLFYVGGTNAFGVYYTSTAGTLYSRGWIGPIIKNPTRATGTTGVYVGDNVNGLTIGGNISEQALGVRAPSVDQDIYLASELSMYDNTADRSGVTKTRLSGAVIEPLTDAFNNLGSLTRRFGSLYLTTSLRMGSGVQVVGVRDTGWTPMVGVPDKSGEFNAGTVTLDQLARRVKAIQDALTTHGLIGPTP
jgi:hypothetical protein